MKRLPIFVVFFAAAVFNISYCREHNSPSQGTMVAISESSALGDSISIKVRGYERPLLVTGSSIEGGTDEEWLGVFSKLQAPYLLSYDQYKEIVTSAFLEMTGDTSEAHFHEVMNKIRAIIPNRKPLKSSVLSTVNLTCKSGEFMIITEYGGDHILSAKSAAISESQKTMILLRKIDGKWKGESFNLIEEIGIDLIPWKNLVELKALEKCSKAVLLDGKLHAQE